MSELVECEYSNCDVKLPVSEMEDIGEYNDHVYVCKSCIDKVENQSGYCSISCQLGYGCDNSC